MAKIEKYIQVLTIAQGLGNGLIAVIKGFAQRDLSPEEFVQLQADWDALVVRTARNAGLAPAE